MKGQQKFPKRERILKPGEYKELYREGTRYSVGEFLLFVKPAEKGPTRVGISVSRKVGRATTRNRVKRYVREVFRTHKERLKPELRMVIVARPSAAQLDFAQCRDKLMQLFRKGDMLRG